MSEIEHANRHHWDGRAKDYDTKPWQQKMINYIYGQLAEHRDMFDLSKEHNTTQDYRLLDYACGPGTVTRSLLPYVAHIQGIDVSDGMVAEYNERSEKAGTTSIATALQGNLLGDEPYITQNGEKSYDINSDSKLNNFDAAIVGLGFHHFSDWVGSLQKLSRRVKPGGIVGIIDLAPSDQHWKNVTEEQKKMMHKSGFTPEEMEGYMRDAGFVDFEFRPLPEGVTMEYKDGGKVERKVFFARGRRPPAKL